MPVDDRHLVTYSSLMEDLDRAGIKKGDVVLVHTSLSALGFVVGAARTVIEAVLESVGHTGTVMMPTYSGELSNPAEWRYPPVRKEWIKTIRTEMQAYDPLKTPTRGMGAVAELFRHWPGAIRSSHPQSSFTAIGAQAEFLVGDHPLDIRFGLSSPLGKLREIDGTSLLLGAPPQTCSLYYLSQHELEDKLEVRKSTPMMIDGVKKWVDYRDIEYPNHWFNDVTRYLVDAGIVKKTLLGAADCYLLPARKTIASVVDWRRKQGV